MQVVLADGPELPLAPGQLPQDLVRPAALPLLIPGLQDALLLQLLPQAPLQAVPRRDLGEEEEEERRRRKVRRGEGLNPVTLRDCMKLFLVPVSSSFTLITSTSST